MVRPELLMDSPHEVLAFVQERIEMPLEPRGFQAIGVTRRGKLVGGCVFHDMQRNRGDIWLSIAGNGAWLTDEVLHCFFWNIFENLACAHATCRLAEDNIKARRALERVGFVEEGRQRRAWDGKRDAILMGYAKWRGNAAKES